MEITILLMILLTQAGGLWMAWKLLNKPIAEVPVTVRIDPKPEPAKLTCYFCNNQFAESDVERVGAYTYCREHGNARKQLMSSNWR